MADKTSPKRWRRVSFEVKKEHEELASWLMMQLGANGCETDVNAGERSRITATFEVTALPTGTEGRIAAAFDEYGINEAALTVRYGELVEQDWLAKWKEGFDPFTIGEHLIISPPWRRDGLTAEQTRARQVVIIDPGLAFGTGFHETTKFCLQYLQQYVTESKNVLDIGSGSGILSIACALLNPNCSITALEIDETACHNAQENFSLNKVGHRIVLHQAGTELLKNGERFDLILANLTYEDHVALMNDYRLLAAAGALQLFAGILAEKADAMEALLNEASLAVIKREQDGKWTGFIARHN